MEHEEMMARGANRREGAATIERLDPRLLTGETNYLFNIYSTEHTINLGTAGQYYVPPCPEGKDYVRSPTVIPGTVEDIYPHFGEKEEYRCRPTPGEDVVKAALGIGFGQRPEEDIRRFGIFSSTNAKPTKQELDEAKKRLVAGLQTQIRKADELFASAKPEERQSVYSDHFHKAARYLGIKKPWMNEAQEMTVCPFCSVGVSPTASICHGCGQIISQERFDAVKASLATKKQLAGVA
jgi:hypothetical protein